MPLSPEIVELISQLSEERNAYKRNWDAICDEFKIPQDERVKPYIPGQILERVRTYLSGYIGRRSIAERENGAAFHKPTPPQDSITDLDVS